MKKILIFSILVFGCAYDLGNLSVVSTKELDMGAYYVKVADNVEGRSMYMIIIFVPTKFKPNNIEEAIKDALWSKGGDLMTNCSIYQTVWYIPYVYGENKLTIVGDVWKKSPNDIGTIDLDNLQENQQVFVFEDGVLKPVEDIVVVE